MRATADPNHRRPHAATLVAAQVAAAACVIGQPALAQDRACADLEVARWLLGTWTAPSGGKRVTESWRRVSESTFEGEGVTYSGETGAREASEDLRLVSMASAVFYVAKVSHNARPVAFGLTDCRPGRLVFENPEHDFPRRLEYAYLPPDRMSVRVSDGGSRGFTLEFRRDD